MDDPQIPQPREAFFVILVGFLGTLLFMQVLLLFLVGNDVEGLARRSGLPELLAVVGEACLLVVPLWFVRKKQLPLRDVFRWHPVPGKVILLSIPLGISLTVLGDELDRLIQMLIPMPEFMEEMLYSLKAETPLEWTLMVLGAVVIAALVEESIIRGFLQQSLEHFQNVTRAVIYASLVWTAIHMMLYWAVQIFLLGIILGYLAWRTNSIAPSALCHGINNLIALLFLNFGLEEKLPGYLWQGHVSPLIVVPALVLVVKIIQYLDHSYRLAGEETSEGAT